MKMRKKKIERRGEENKIDECMNVEFREEKVGDVLDGMGMGEKREHEIPYEIPYEIECVKKLYCGNNRALTEALNEIQRECRMPME